MNNNEDSPTNFLKEAVKQLRGCQPLVDRLKAHGVTIQLSPQEIKSIQIFEKLVLAGYNDSQWSYLRVASGIQLSGVAKLSTCLTRFLAQTIKPVS